MSRINFSDSNGPNLFYKPIMVFISIGNSRNFSHFFLHMLLKTSAYLHSILKAVWHYFGYKIGNLIQSYEF